MGLTERGSQNLPMKALLLQDFEAEHRLHPFGV